MPTVAQLVSDVELQLNQGEISDDSSLDRRQIKFWLSNNLNALVANEINSKITRGEQIPSVYQKVDSLGISEDEESGEVDRIFIELDEEVLTVNKDAGIVFVETDQRNQIDKASTETMTLFRNLRFSKPSETNLLYYRIGNKLYIEGLKSVDLPFESIYVWYVPKQDILSLEDTDEVLVSDLVLPELIGMTVQQGKLQLYGTQPDVANDGTDVKSVQYHTAIKNPTEQ
jgi:hypothetical protein